MRRRTPEEALVTNIVARNPRSGPGSRKGRLRPRLTGALAALVVLVLLFPAGTRADTLAGTVKDPTGAVVAGARIEITGGTLPRPLVLSSDASGKFSAPNLAPGNYSVRVAKEG